MTRGEGPQLVDRVAALERQVAILQQRIPAVPGGPAAAMERRLKRLENEVLEPEDPPAAPPVIVP